MDKTKGELGLIGLAVMGQNLALNFADHGIRIHVYNRSIEKTQDFLQRNPHECLSGFEDLKKFVQALQRPRKIILMVKAGDVVDQFALQLFELLDKGDIIIDGGNSLAAHTDRRMQLAASKGLHWVGAGISGGELGARFGPAVMLGGSAEIQGEIVPLFSRIAAKDFQGGACCHWFGSGGIGHFVKTVHNGIEYGDMQLICEVYDLLSTSCGFSNEEIAEIFSTWSQGRLGGYLTEISAEILKFRGLDGTYVVDAILDVAGQKGTGRWTCESALNLGVPLTLIQEAVAARSLSSQYTRRGKLNELYGFDPGNFAQTFTSKEEMIDALEHALWASRLVSYAQGFDLLQTYVDEREFELQGKEVARTWSGGCIIRSRLLEDIYQAYDKQKDLAHLLMASEIIYALKPVLVSWRQVVSRAVSCAMALPAMSSALSYFEAITRRRLPANLLQAQRDYFGAHTYERVDRPRGEFFHTDWNATGGSVSSASYNA